MPASAGTDAARRPVEQAGGSTVAARAVTMTPSTRETTLHAGDRRSPTRTFAVGAGRAAGGAVIFGLPLLMTMEMWEIGARISPLRLALLVALTLPLLVGLSRVAGFEETVALHEDVADALVAWAIGFVVSAGVLFLFGVVRLETTPREALGMLALQAVPASIGALLSQSQLGGQKAEDEARDRGETEPGYWRELFLMLVGALFLAFNVAPTEEMVLIAYMMSPWHVLALSVVSLAMMHGFVYAVEFRGQESVPGHMGATVAFVRFTVVGYAIALVVSAYVLWTFGRLDHMAWSEQLSAALVLGFPAAIGAAAARLLL